MRRLQEGKLPKTLELASDYFHDLTGGNYTKVYLHENRLQVKSNQVVLFFPEELSQATKEQLYLAIRFALIDVIHKDFPLPIIIDDGFVHFDATRMSQMMQLLKKERAKIKLFSSHAIKKHANIFPVRTYACYNGVRNFLLQKERRRYHGKKIIRL